MPSPGEGGELRRPECGLRLSGSGAGAGEASLRGQGLRTRASWPAGEVGAEAASREGRRGRPVRPELRVPRAACALRAPWLRGSAATPARWRWRRWFAGLAQSRRWSRYLAAQPQGARPAAAAPGEHSGRPRSRRQHPPPTSSAAAARRSCTPAPREPSPGGPVRARARQAGRAAPATLAASGLDVGPPGGELSAGTLSPAAGVGVCEAVAPPSSAPPAGNLTLLPCTWTAPLRSARQCTPPLPQEAQLLTSVIAPLRPYGADASPPLEPSEAAADGNRLGHRRNKGFWRAAALPRAPQDHRGDPSPPRAPGRGVGGRCMSRLIARAELANRLAPSLPAPAPAGTGLGRAGGAAPAAGAQRQPARRWRPGRERNREFRRPAAES